MGRRQKKGGHNTGCRTLTVDKLAVVCMIVEHEAGSIELATGCVFEYVYKSIIKMDADRMKTE